METLADLLGRLGQVERQEELFRRIAAVVSDELGISADQREAVIHFEIAARGLAAVPPSAPPAFVARTFDVFADQFEKDLRESLRYRGPEQIMQRLERAFGRARGALRICDAGCGTGVLGPFLRPYASRLEGVDLSPRMIEKAAAQGAYDQLDVDEMVAHLVARAASPAPTETGPFDVITAADVFVYIGDLRPVFEAVAAALRPNGHFFFTVERAEGSSFVLNYNARYAHSAAYLREVASHAGLREVSIEEEILRRERGLPVRSWIAAFERAPRPDEA